MAIETPGYLLDLMKLDKFNLTVVELDQGEKIPNNLSSFDAMQFVGDGWANGYMDGERISLVN